MVETTPFPSRTDDTKESKAGAKPPKGLARRLFHLSEVFTHAWARLRGRTYSEDYIRVYPDGIHYNPLGWKNRASEDDLKNFKNHLKVYAFTAQFVPHKVAVDVGCGSGYGADYLVSPGGAAKVYACDASKAAIKFAKGRYGSRVLFAQMSATKMSSYPDHFADVTVSSEVLEHVKEFGAEGEVVSEIRRITKPKGIVVLGTPNSEMFPDHGFSYAEIDGLLKDNFRTYCLFENALVPFSRMGRDSWELRAMSGRHGVIVSERLDFGETVIPSGVTVQTKVGIDPGPFQLGELTFDTSLLHNTHSWLAVAINQ